MHERFSFFNEAFVRIFVGVSFFFFSSCGVPPALEVKPTASTSIGCSSPPLTIMDRNPYLKHPISKNITTIFRNFSNNPRIARQDAIMQLGKNTKHWSAYINIIGNDNQMTRVLITYLDPVLVQYIILNDVLSLSGGMNEVDLITKIQSEMNNLAQDDKLFFIIVITTPIYNGTNLSVDIPVENLILVNSDGMKTRPIQYDYFLTENINITQGPVFGIMGYPVSVKSGETCIAFINEQTSSLTLDLDRLNLGEEPFESLFWNIYYQSLITQDDNHTIPTYDQDYDSRLYKLEHPPIPNLRMVAGFDEKTARYYWEDMGRYLWNVLIGETGH